MTDHELEAETERVLAQARRELSPTNHDAERSLAAVHGAFTASPVVTQTTTSNLARTLRSGAPLSMKLIVGAAVVALVSGAIGYIVGYRAALIHNLRLQPSAAVRSAPIPSRRAAASVHTPTASDMTKLPSPREPEQHESLAVDRPTPTSTAARTKKAPVVSFEKPHEIAKDPKNDGGSMEVELRALGRVELALREHHPQLALSILDGLDREVPDGQLGQERLAAFAVARCAIGLGSRAALLQEFERSHPDSVYLGRVKQSCRTQP
jgi:hypothetical protein